MVNQLKIQSTIKQSEFIVLNLKPTLLVSKNQINELAHLYNIHSIILECVDKEYVNMTLGCPKPIHMKNYIYFNLWMHNIDYDNQEAIFNNVRFFVHANNLENNYHNIDNVSDDDLIEYNDIMNEKNQIVNEECKSCN